MPAAPRRLFHRRALRRVAGGVVLALFALQSTAFASTHCDGQSSRTAPQAMPGMSHAQHDMGNADAPSAPERNRRPDCDHSVPAGGCSVAGGCVVAVPGTILTVALSHPAPAREFLAPAEATRSLEFAPDTPPPRA